MLTLTALLLLLAALPDLMQRLGRRDPALASTGPGPGRHNDPGLRPLALLDDGLLKRLREADEAWVPRAEPLPDGGIRYLYKRRPGEPELTIAQIRALIASPPDRDAEHREIVALLTTLEEVGAGVGLMEPIKTGAAAEWDPQERTLRIRPDVPDQGTLEFARVLNHEAIHVAQSCAAGGVGASPRPLALADGGAAGNAPGQVARTGADAASMRQLGDPVYADLSPRERRMEKEAYALQNRLGLGERLVRLHCLDGRAAG